MASRIVQLGRNAWREARAEDSGVLVDAADYYRAFYNSAGEASRYVLISGWQFDSSVPLLRGDDAPPDAEVRFVNYLNGLCDLKPKLHVYILAWNFHPVLAAEREWLQRLIFGWMTSPRFRFLFDDAPVSGGSHHQKFAVFDGAHGFLGGMDVCEARWDDRRHRGDNPLRTTRGKPHKPYHDVQAWVAGRSVAAALEEEFGRRWERAGGGRLELPRVVGRRPKRPRGLVAVGSATVALSRTEPREKHPAVREVEHLFVDAIERAERLLYVETQYFSSRRICEALIARMRRRSRGPLQIVLLVNERAEALKEELAVGLRQAENLQRLRAVAASTGNALGIYYSLCDAATEQFQCTYLHSKVVLADDRFLTVGSANLTNRSMGTDSELHVSWEAVRGKADASRVERAIRRVRVSLLAEHAGVRGVAAVRRLVRCADLVARLEEMAVGLDARLRRHEAATAGQAALIGVIDPKGLPFDPDTSPGAEEHAELRDEPVDEARSNGGPSDGRGRTLWDQLRRLALLLLAPSILAAGCAGWTRAPQPPPPPAPVAQPTLLDFEATAYSIDGRTATGARTREGIVAADPSVLPLGSRIRIHEAGEYSGEYVVKDTGRTIRGREVDIYLANDGEAKRFGRKKVKVEVLDRGASAGRAL